MPLSARQAFVAALVAGMAAPALAAGAGPVTVFYNGKVLTVDARQSRASAFVVTGGRFSYVGGDKVALARAGKAARKVDLRGATVVPGLCDAHDHLWNTARFLHRGVDIVGVTDPAELRKRLAEGVARSKGETVFTTIGLSQPAPTRQQLDAISATVPIVIIGGRRGAPAMNTAALAKLGITRDKAEYRGRKVPVDASGEPLGTIPFYPQGMEAVQSLIPQPTVQQQRTMIAAEMRRRNEYGATCARDLAIWPSEAAAYERLSAMMPFTIRVSVGIEGLRAADALDFAARLKPIKRGNPWFVADVLGEEPWPPAGANTAEFTQMAMLARKAGWRTDPHTSADPGRGIGPDAPIEAVLEAYETVHRAMPIVGRRWMMEHAPFSTPAMMDRMARLGVIVSVQDQGFEPVPQVARPADPGRPQNPVRTMLDKGLVVLGGTDTGGPSAKEPEPDNLWRVIQYLIVRRAADGKLVFPEQAITREEALRLFTANPAFAQFAEKERGSIAPGLLADFAVLNHDYLTMPAEEIEKIRATATYVGGRKVWPSASTKG